jgi:hypothetical protein
MKHPEFSKNTKIFGQVKFVLFLRNFYFVNQLNNNKSQKMVLTFSSYIQIATYYYLFNCYILLI